LTDLASTAPPTEFDFIVREFGSDHDVNGEFGRILSEPVQTTHEFEAV
jgi:hypothetical protein